MIGLENGIEEIQSLIGGEWKGNSSLLAVSDPVRFLAYDTRKILHPDATVFLALTSGKRDGHDFVQAAFDKGVRFFILEKKMALPEGGLALVVPNSLAALQTLARKRRESHSVQAGITGLPPVSVGREMLTNNPEITIINDAYNADDDSVLDALTQLLQSDFQVGHALVLSDVEDQGKQQESMQRMLLEKILKQLGPEDIFLVGPVYVRIALDHPKVSAYPDIEALASRFDYRRFKNKTVLLKGAQQYQLEQLIPYLSRRASATCFKINLDHLRHNLHQFRSRLTPGTKLMAMVKAFAYGAGDWEIAQELAEEGVDYLAVAYTSTGIALRTHGVTSPIMVMNADPDSLAQLYRFKLEPVIYGFDFLRDYLLTRKALRMDRSPLHIEVDTGMGRLGFAQHEVDALLAQLKKHPEVEVKSVMSHFSMADDPSSDVHTHEQASWFESFADTLTAGLSNAPLRHISNTAGILRFPGYHFDMVRLGLGLYGISPLAEETLDLRELGSLVTHISQIHAYPAGQPISYGGTSVTTRPSRIATLPIGYADGIRRSLSNGKMSFLVRGQRAAIIGRVCMDMLMLDVTDLPEVVEGDEVVLLGRQGNDFISVNEMAEAAETIPYEILVNIGQRVRRIYEQE